MTVSVVDPRPGSGASGAAAGLLAPVTEVHYGEEALLRLNLAGAAAYPDFVAELEQCAGMDVGYRRTGTKCLLGDVIYRAAPSCWSSWSSATCRRRPLPWSKTTAS